MRLLFAALIAILFSGATAWSGEGDPLARLDPLLGSWIGNGTVRAKPGAPERAVQCRARYSFTSDSRNKIKASVICESGKTKSTFVAFIAPSSNGGLRGSWWQSQDETSGEIGGDLLGDFTGEQVAFSVDAAGKVRGMANISIGRTQHNFVVQAIDDASQSLNITFSR